MELIMEYYGKGFFDKYTSLREDHCLIPEEQHLVKCMNRVDKEYNEVVHMVTNDLTTYTYSYDTYSEWQNGIVEVIISKSWNDREIKKMGKREARGFMKAIFKIETEERK